MKMHAAFARLRVGKRAKTPPLHAVGTMPVIAESFDGGSRRVQCGQAGNDNYQVTNGLGGDAVNRRLADVMDRNESGDASLKAIRVGRGAERRDWILGWERHGGGRRAQVVMRHPTY